MQEGRSCLVEEVGGIREEIKEVEGKQSAVCLGS
jgi:hypothetical protein